MLETVIFWDIKTGIKRDLGFFNFWLGTLIYIGSSLIQFWTHRRFEDMKKAAIFIPNGPLFSFTFCPHYIAEILIYISYNILTDFKIKGLILCLLETSISLASAIYMKRIYYAKVKADGTKNK